MSVADLAQRVAALELEIHVLKERLDVPTQSKDWRQTVGAFDNDEVFAEMVKEGRKFRDEQRELDVE